jgi:CHAT domain-containing protein
MPNTNISSTLPNYLAASQNNSLNNAIATLDKNKQLRFGMGYLPATKTEVENISSTLTAEKWKVNLVEDKDASEGKFKTYAGSNATSILHIATHGFAYDEKKEANESWNDLGLRIGFKYQSSDDPMIRSGLLFGGANITWKGKGDSLLKSTNDDGILTALELSQMDLSNTKLAVLSACETGKGAIVGSEGTFGLQRALKLAGVDNMIVSLWKVPDDATQEMMTLFYNNLSATKKIVASFNDAQKTMRNKYPDEPIKWGGFVLIR